MTMTPGNHRIFSDSQRDKMRELRSGGATWKEIAERYSCSPQTIQKAIDPGYAEIRTEKRREYLAARATTVVAKPVKPAAPPQDTRNLTGQLFGDPLPGRSALDSKPVCLGDKLWRVSG